jgi:tRNA threonylcarbamoyladenosine biosynthesis protein TsaB
MLLAIDTSTRVVGLALYDGVQVVSERTWHSQDHHTVEVAPALQSLLQQAGLAGSQLPAKLQAIGVALGPGSFTSLRAGLALAKGLALALHIPLVGIPTLDVLAVAQPLQDLPLAAVLHAGRGRLAVGWYKVEKGAWRSPGPARVMTAEDLAAEIHKPTLVCGELTAEERQLLRRKRKNVVLASPARSLRRPAFLAELAWTRWRAGKVDDPVSLAPVYLHVAEAIPA